MNAPVVSAPGKVFLAGEYAVLDGGAAVVAAISRRASARFVPGAEPSSPLIAEVMRVARETFGSGLPAGSVVVDTSAFVAGGQKLGVGSSAAAAVAAAGAAWTATGEPLSLPPVGLTAGLAHKSFQGGLGSGADVMVSTSGGLRLVTNLGGSLADDPLPPLPAELVVFSTGRAASTVDFLRAVGAFAARAPDRHAPLMRTIDQAARALATAVKSSDASAVIEAARAAHAVMNALGRAADAPIVTPALAAAAALAAELGGAAKPSGAGGGDVGVGFFPDGDAARAFGVRAGELGITILDVTIDLQGVSPEAS